MTAHDVSVVTCNDLTRKAVTGWLNRRIVSRMSEVTDLLSAARKGNWVQPGEGKVEPDSECVRNVHRGVRTWRGDLVRNE